MQSHDSRRRGLLQLMAAGSSAAVIASIIPPALRAAAASAAGTLATLQTAIGTKLLTPADAGFESASRSIVWNPRYAEAARPSGIVRATATEDVVAAVKFASSNGLKVSVRSGGHHYFGAPLRADSLLIDLSQLNDVSIDPTRQRASVQPAVKGGQLLSQLDAHRFAFPVGHCSDVGLGGYLLAGGMGINSLEWGPACLSVEGIEMVTAGGEVLHTDAQHHADLFWAARGAGHGFFAVATRFDLRVYPLPAGIHVFAASYPLRDAPTVARWLTRALHVTHATVEATLILGAAEAGAPPAVTLLAVAFDQTSEAAREKLSALRAGPPRLAAVGPVFDQASTLRGVHELMDAGFPAGRRMGADVLWTDATPADVIDRLTPFVAVAPPPPSAIVLVCAGLRGKPYVMPTGAQSSLSRSSINYLGAYCFWESAADDQKHAAWPRKVLEAVRSVNAGSYIGEADVTNGLNSAEQCFDSRAWNRLRELRSHYDPHGVFHGYLGV